MIRVDTSVEGIGRVEAALTGVSDEMIPNAASGLKKGLLLVERDAKKLCPVNTGELRNSIKASVTELATSATGEVGSPLEHASYVEMGTGEVGKASGGNGSPVSVSYRTGGWFVPLARGEQMMADTIVEGASNGFWTYGQPARPYLWPAYQANKDKILAAVRAAIMEGLSD